MFMSVTMSIVGDKIQNVRIKINSFLLNSAIINNGEILQVTPFYMKFLSKEIMLCVFEFKDCLLFNEMANSVQKVK